MDARPASGGKRQKLVELGGYELNAAPSDAQGDLRIDWESPRSVLVGSYPVHIKEKGQPTVQPYHEVKQDKIGREAAFPVLWLGATYQQTTYSSAGVYDRGTVVVMYSYWPKDTDGGTPSGGSRVISIRQDDLVLHPVMPGLYGSNPDCPYIRDVPLSGGITGKMYATQDGTTLVFQRGGVLISIRDDACSVTYPDSDKQTLAADAAGLVSVP